jgi:hypothetical protein
VHDAADAWVARARAKAANDSWEETLPQVVPGMEVEGWGGRKMQNAVNTSLHGGIELCGINALRDAADGEGGFFFSGPIRLGLPCAQVWRETLERSGRLHDISAALDQLKRIGVRRVCWLRPNEEVRLFTVAVLTVAVLTGAQRGV